MRPSIRFSEVRLAGECSHKEHAIGGNGRLIEGVKRGARRLRALVRRCCFWATFAALAACATFDVTPFLREQITGDSWRACLAREYQAQSRFQVRHGRHWDEATHLAAKGRAALDGEDPTTDPIPEALAPQASALSAAIARSGRQCGCATTQARLDGWSVALAQDPARDQAAFAKAFAAALPTCVPPG